ncbi:MAG TPA: 50S ribosomal protein L5 [Candidatus Izemoplasmatales bacterium]|nr:50S ribosomal protein L5 [Candidatus Izemoplasmatales bacterium]
MNRLQEKYKSEIIPAMTEKFKYSSVMQCPKISKITLNIGAGDAVENPKVLDDAVAEITQIAGQKPVVTKAKKSIASFKLREGMPIGCKVTLRGERMYDFLDKLITIDLPRVRDFRGVNPRGFDGRGNYTLGVREQLIFPEINYDKVNKIRGMDIVIVTTAKTDKESLELLKMFGMPFRRN